MKFSIIIPVYGVEKYIDKCLKSVLDQSYKNYEVIVVNDGSPDNSQEIIDKYVELDNRFKTYSKKNGGLSDARNFGVQYATGDYIIFIDSDDYIEEDLLLNVSKCAEGNDLIKYNINLVDENGNLIRKAKTFQFTGEVNFKELISAEYFQPAWSYAYNLKFWKNNKFKYEVGKIHEDFGLTPLCALLAKKIYITNYYGYNYVQRQGSITNGAEKMKKRANDILYHFDSLRLKIPDIDAPEEYKKICLSVLANQAIYVASLLNKDDFKDYIEKLKNRKIYKYLLDNNLPRKLKILVAKYNLELYIKYRFRNKNNRR